MIKFVDHTVSSTNKTDSHDISEILLKVALNTITQPTPTPQKVRIPPPLQEEMGHNPWLEKMTIKLARCCRIFLFIFYLQGTMMVGKKVS